jgi:uncharacterized glyoxalase superfamily protein PhnB
MQKATFVLTLALGKAEGAEEGQTMMTKRITPVLFVQDVAVHKVLGRTPRLRENCRSARSQQVGFAMLQKGSVELMYQSYASADKDVAAISQVVRKGPSFLYVEVDSLDQTIAAIQGAEVVTPVRTTFYGATETSIKDPGGHFVTFAEFGASPQH